MQLQKGHQMYQSYKNTSSGNGEGQGKGNTGAHYQKIKENIDPKPPSGASNSYEKIRVKIDNRDSLALAKGPYTREKLMNK